MNILSFTVMEPALNSINFTGISGNKFKNSIKRTLKNCSVYERKHSLISVNIKKCFKVSLSCHQQNLKCFFFLSNNNLNFPIKIGKLLKDLLSYNSQLRGQPKKYTIEKKLEHNPFQKK